MDYNRQAPQSRIALVVIILAIVLAVIFFFVLVYALQRPLPPAGQAVLVNDQWITTNLNPALEVRVLEPAPPPPAQVFEAETQEEPPAEPEPEPEPVVEAPAEPAPPAPASVDSIIFIDYHVQPGDTLYSISRNRIDTNISLMSRYSISAKSLVVNDIIRLPIGNPDYCTSRRPYAVREGDTAFSIARRFNISLDDLRAVNNLDANATIYVATIICLP
jgi:LysM repeat protein